MSREIIRDVVIPIVSKIMMEEGHFSPYRPFDIRDESLEEFLEEEMRRYFGVIGANGCQHLKEQLEEARRNDPFAFEFLLKQLLKKYVKLQVKVRKARKEKLEHEGPPDRFLLQRRSARSLLGYGE